MVNKNRISIFGWHSCIIYLLLFIQYAHAIEKKAKQYFTNEDLVITYKHIKRWATANLLLSNNDINTGLKPLEKYVDQIPEDLIRRIIRFVTVNIKDRVNNTNNYANKAFYKIYFVKKYLNNKLQEIPTIITNSTIDTVIKMYYRLLRYIYIEYTNFTRQNFLPENLPKAINTVEKIIKLNFIVSKEDYYHALLLFGTEKNLINDMLIYAELHDKENIDEKLRLLIHKISQHIKYNTTNVSHKSGSTKRNKIKNDILDKIPKEIPNDINLNYLYTILTSFIELQKAYTAFETSTKEATKNIPTLCNQIKEWLKNTTLALIPQPTCNKEQIQNILYTIRAQLIPKYHELERKYPVKITTTENSQKYRLLKSTLDNLELVGQELTTDQTQKTKDNNIFESEEAFNFLKNAYAFYEITVQPIYRSWAQNNGIPCSKEDNLRTIVDNIHQTLSAKIATLNKYEASTMVQNADLKSLTLYELSIMYNRIIKKEESLKKLYFSWATNNGLIDYNNSKNKSLEQITADIKAAIQKDFFSLPKQYQDSRLASTINNATTLQHLSATYTKVHEKKQLPILEPNNKPTTLIITPSITLSNNAPKQQGWFSWFSSWFYSSNKK